jgi:hypothetical protein
MFIVGPMDCFGHFAGFGVVEIDRDQAAFHAESYVLSAGDEG